MMRRFGLRRRDERGAMVMLMAGLMSVLITVAALGVDLGNAWQRKVTVQKSVDVSAVSAGHLLPRTGTNSGDILLEVATYLLKTSNHVSGQSAAATIDPGAIAALADNLDDGDRTDGEVIFLDDETMTVVAPQAHVDYGLAGIVGVDSVEVSAEATVQIRTPIMPIGSVLPMWLPAACVYGPLAGDVAAPPPADSPEFKDNMPRSSFNVLTTLTPSTMTYGTLDQTVSIVIDAIPEGKTGAIIRFTFGAGKYVDFRVTWTTATTSTDSSRTVSINLDETDATIVNRTPSDATVPSTVGEWQVWPLIPTTAAPPALPLTTGFSNPEYPKNNTTISEFSVTGGGSVACNDHEIGNFGQLTSPRDDSDEKQTVYARNVAFGLDHELAAFDSEPATYECPADDDPAGAQIDDDTTPDNNCLYVDPGNDPQGLTDGLLGGGRITEGEGRLQKPNSDRCSSRPALVIDGKSYNNDTLSCFLKPGYDLSDIASNDSPEDVLYADIRESPRFFYVPVVWQGDRELKKYIAIKTFAPAFLTDETIADPDGTETNGLILNPGGKIQAIQIFGFNEVALPIPPNADTTDYQEGTRGVIRLIG